MSPTHEPWSVASIGTTGEWVTYRLTSNNSVPITSVVVAVDGAQPTTFHDTPVLLDRMALFTLKVPTGTAEEPPTLTVTWLDGDNQQQAWTSPLPK